MPSLTHEGLIELIRYSPALAVTLLRDYLGVTLPVHTKVRLHSADLSEITPTEYRADLVIVLFAANKPVLGVVAEAQLHPRRRKRFTWPQHAAALRARLECDACVLVLTPSAAVARWAARPIQVGPGSTFTPLVVGPQGIPVITDPKQAKPSPELGVLSAIAHGKGHAETAAAVALAAVKGAEKLEEERAMLYWDLIWEALSEAARKELSMNLEGYVYKSDFARKYFTQGEVKGKVEGKAEGSREAKAAAVLVVLEARGLAVSKRQREQITKCTSTARLTRWLRRAATASSTSEVLG